MRPTIEEYFLSMAKLVASRATCHRRKVGCVLVNKDNHILATGYNGVPRGFDHCNEGNKCPGADSLSGRDLDKCFAVHAEQNALLQCKNTNEVAAAYVTAAPCMQCIKSLLNTSCQVIWAAEEYPHSDSVALWQKAGRKISYKKDLFSS